MRLTGLVGYVAKTPSLAKTLGSLRSLRMPEDREQIANLINSSPEEARPYIKSIAAFWQKRCTGVLYPVSISVDTTLACNFACPGCYIASDLYTPTKENIEKGSSVEEWLRKFEQLHAENPFIWHASWAGGEPTLRKNLLDPGVKYFSNNWIHTNGYIPFPADLGDRHHKVNFAVSIDGYREHHDKMRPTRGNGLPTYDRVLKNIRESKGVSIKVHTVISPDNLETLGLLIKDLYNTRKVDSVGFSFLSPQKGERVFTRERRDVIVDQLIVHRRQYGKFIFNTPSMLKAMKSDSIRDTYASGCLIKITENGGTATIPLDVHGNIKEQCVMGPKQSCSECGCIIPAYYKSMFDDTVRTSMQNLPVVGKLLH